MFILLIILSTALPYAFSIPFNAVESAGISINTVSSDSELQDDNKNKVVTFRPNVASSTGLTAETKHIVLSYFFTGNEARSKNHEKSKYQDLRLNFHFRHFDFRLNYQSYRGAVVDERGVSEFYKDYEVKSNNGRMHYYFTKDYLNYIREGKVLLDKVSKNEGFSPSGSGFLGLNMDNRNIQLPKNLVQAHLNEISENGIEYNNQFSAFSWGPLIGYDFLLQYSSVYFRGKIAAGPAFQSGGDTVEQFEMAFNSGFTVRKNHLLSLGFDMFVMSFKDDSQYIQNSNSQVSFAYTYAFR